MANPQLRLAATADTRPAPYPADTRAKGWRFEIDYERLSESDTWVLAPPDMRPWLLMLWLTSWKQAPCGSLPNDDRLIAARIGMPDRQFAANRDLLMRGWVLHDDGRLYHKVITERVVELIGCRLKEAARKQAYREKNQPLAPNVPRDGRGVPVAATLPEPEPEPEPEKSKTRGTEVIAAAAAPAKPRATRLSADWALPKAWGEWSVAELGWPGEVVRTEAAKFADFWHAKSGKDATKLDWLATWRNWCRNARVAISRPMGRAPSQSTADRDAEARRLLGFAPTPLEAIDA